MVVNDIRISQKMKKKTQLSIEKNISKSEKIKICYKHLKWDLSFLFIQMNAKISFFSKKV